MPKVIQVRNFNAINDEEWRVLTAVETGMRNHEFVPLDLLHNYAGINHSGKNFIKILRSSLVPHRLIAFESNGYRLTNLGYDFLALHKFIKSNIVYDLLNFQLFATGKESDLYFCKPGQNCHDEYGISDNCPIVLKFHRLGRTSFKQVKNKREYKNGNNCSWIYMNRISATREYCTMKELYDAKLPVPVPLGHNRGAVAMEYINSVPLFKFSKDVLEHGAAAVLYDQAKELLIKLAQLGLVHGDFNEFNLLVEVDGYDALRNASAVNDVEIGAEDADSGNSDAASSEECDDEDEDGEQSQEEDETDSSDEYNENLDCVYANQDINTFKLRLIDFPQVISRDNKIGQEIYERDRHGVVSFFSKFTSIEDNDLPPQSISDIQRTGYLDVRLKAPGYPRGEPVSDNDGVDKQLSGEEEDDVNVDGQQATVMKKSYRDVKKKVNKERSKQVAKQRINKQQRNIRKKENRKDLNTDLFE